MSNALARWLEGIWYHGKPGAALLAPLSGLFAVVTALRRAAFHRGLRRVYRARVPVVIVGNLSVGGTGKSPLVGALVRALQQRGLRVGILLRGYGSAVREPTRVTTETSANRVGDEAVMLAASTAAPVIVSPDRLAGAEALQSIGVDLILCDDGLQHYALARDREIVVIDAVRGLGNGRLLPAGPLREGLGRLASVDWVVLNGADGSDDLPPEWRGRLGTLAMQLVPEALRGVRDERLWRSLESFRGTPIHAVAGIGHPARFFAMLRAAGLELIEHPFADHHAFVASDLAFGDDRAILMTAKDAVKCRAFADARCWEVPVAVRLAPQEGGALVADIAALATASPATSSPSTPSHLTPSKEGC